MKDDRGPILFGLFLSSMLTLIIFRKFFFFQGIVNTGDLQWPYYSTQRVEYLSTLYQPPNHLLFYSWLWHLPLTPAILERLMYFLVFTLMALSAFYVTFKVIENEYEKHASPLFVAGIASVVYMLNPLNVYHSQHIFLLIGYALFPFIIYAILKYWESDRDSIETLKYALLLGIVFTLISGDPRWPFWGFFTLLLLSLIFGLTSKEKYKALKNTSKLIAFTFSLFLILNSFWLVPLIKGSLVDTPGISSQETYYLLNQHASIINSLRFQADFWEPTRGLFLPQSKLNVRIWRSSGLILPIFAFSALILNPKKREVIALSLFSLVVLAIATAPFSPIKFMDEIYQYFIFNINFGIAFRTSYKWLLLMSYPLVLLSSFLFSRIFNKPQLSSSQRIKPMMVVSVILVTTLLISAAINAWPLLTGDIRGSFTPTDLNEEYKAVYEYILHNSDENSFRIAIWPEAPSWSAPVPIIRSSSYTEYLKEGVMDGRIDNLGAYLAPLNVKYVILDKQAPGDLKLYDEILKQEDLKLLYDNQRLTLWEIENPKAKVRVDQTVTSFYGLHKMAPCSTNVSVLFAEQNFEMTEESIFINRMVMGTPFLLHNAERGIIVCPFLFSNHHNPSIWWSRAATSDPLHGQWHPYLKQRYIDNWDFDYGKGLIFTWANDTLSMPIKVKKEDDYDLLVRYFRNKDGGKIGIYFDGNIIDIIDTKEQVNEFTWKKIGTLNISEGEHMLTIENREGFNAVNIFSLIPHEEYENAEEEVYDLIKDKRMIYILECESDFYYYNNVTVSENYHRFSNGKALILSNSSEIFTAVEIIKNGTYRIAVRALTGPSCGDIKINLDFYTYELNITSEKEELEWIYTKPVYLQTMTYNFTLSSSEEATIDVVWIYSIEEDNETLGDLFTSLKIPAEIVSVEEINPTKYIVHVNSTEPFMLAFAESYDPLWVATFDGEKVKSIPLYSVINGFPLDKTGNLTITIEYEPQRWFYYGLIITIVALVVSIGLVIRAWKINLQDTS